MINDQYLGVIKSTIAGFLLGLIIIAIGVFINYHSGFKGPWFNIFEYSPDFSIIIFSPVFFSLLFCFLSIKKVELVLFNKEIKYSLSKEQIINSTSDHQIKLLAKVVEQLNEAIVISDGYGRVQWVNEGFTNITGFVLADVIGKDQTSILNGTKGDKAASKRITEKLIRGEFVVEEQLSYHKNGRAFWLSNSIKAIHDSTGEIINFIAIQNNITGRKEKELSIAALYKEVADYKFALDQSAIVIRFNDAGKIIHVNRRFCEINDLAEDELLGTDFRSISLSMKDRHLVKSIWRALEAGKVWKGELVNQNRNGKIYWADTTVVPLLDGDGLPYQFLAIQQDITERKHLEAQLITHKNELQQAMQIALLGSWDMDIAFKFTISVELRKLYHLPLTGELSITRVLDNIHPDDLRMVKEKMKLIQSALQKVEFEYRYNVGGVFRYMLAKGNPRVDTAGNFIGLFGTVQDITTVKLSELALKKSEEEKIIVLNNTQTIICLHDMAGNIMDINIAAETLSEFHRNDLIGINLRRIISPGYQAEFDVYLHTINNNDTASGTLQMITKSGEKRVWLYQNKVYQNEGNTPYVIASAVDITASVKAQNEIEKQRVLIRQIIDNSPSVIFMLNEQRQVVLANKTFAKYYQYVENEMPFAASLSKGANDVFFGEVESVFEMEAGEIIKLEGSIVNQENDLVAWFSVINKCFTERNGKKYILVFGIDVSGQYQVETDLVTANEMVKQSLKINDLFIAKLSKEIGTPLKEVIRYTDLLDQTSLDHAQMAYVTLVKSAAINLLSIVNTMLNLSKVETNTAVPETLALDIPTRVIPGAEILSDGSHTLSVVNDTAIHVLLAEDNLIHALLAMQGLKRKGFSVVHVTNGEQAFRAIQQHYFDVVLVDVQMPVLDGIATILAIRKLTGSIGKTPIIALADHALNDEMQQCYDAGATAYVVKPFKADFLYDTITTALKNTEIHQQ